ncbi:MAG: glycoside hydrolase, partial [bacterium]|nr:glycoside hydrolase [bacterium]
MSTAPGIVKILPAACLVLCFCAVQFSCTVADENAESTASTTYRNPLPVAFGDPYVLYDSDGRYYMYGTGGGAKDGYGVYSSSDLVNWTYEGQ